MKSSLCEDVLNMTVVFSDCLLLSASLKFSDGDDGVAVVCDVITVICGVFLSLVGRRVIGLCVVRFGALVVPSSENRYCRMLRIGIPESSSLSSSML
jgi:hypothetical protein